MAGKYKIAENERLILEDKVEKLEKYLKRTKEKLEHEKH